MNFKTTIVLILLLLVAAAALYFTRDRGGESTTADTSASSDEGEKLITFSSGDVNKLTVTPADGEAMTIERVEGKWKLTAPVTAPVDSFAVDSLIGAIVDARSRGTVDATENMGVSDPAYQVDIDAAEGKSAKLAVGSKSAVGDVLYVALNGETSRAHIIDAGLLEQLEKPASDFRRKQLIEMPSTDVKQIEVSRPGGKLVLHRVGNDWQVIAPTPMPADASSVTDLISAATSVRAEEFVSESSADAAKYQLDQPQVAVMLSTAAPATQPATTSVTKPATETITLNFGRFADVMKKNIYASVSDAPSIVTLPASSLEKLTVPAITLRDRKVLDIDPQQVSQVVIESNLSATTQPTTRPASKRTITIDRRKEAVALGPTLTTAPAATQSTRPSTTPAAAQASAATGPATLPATRPAATAPAPSKWQLASTTQPADASDARVDSILASLHPLRATEYLEAAPATQPSATYTLTVTTIGAGGAAPQKHVITLSDPGTSGPLVGQANGLIFKVDRSLLTKLEGDFDEGATAPAAAEPAVPHELPPGFGAPE